MLFNPLVRNSAPSIAFVSALAMALGPSFAVVATALAVLTPIREELTVQLGRDPLLVVALIFGVLAASTEGASNGTLVMMWHLRLAAVVGFLHPALHQEALCNRCVVADLSCKCETCSLDAPGVVTPDTARDISEPD